MNKKTIILGILFFSVLFIIIVEILLIFVISSHKTKNTSTPSLPPLPPHQQTANSLFQIPPGYYIISNAATSYVLVARLRDITTKNGVLNLSVNVGLNKGYGNNLIINLPIILPIALVYQNEPNLFPTNDHTKTLTLLDITSMKNALNGSRGQNIAFIFELTTQTHRTIVCNKNLLSYLQDNTHTFPSCTLIVHHIQIYENF